ncbi:MAG: iron-sulfur cluster assembly accessory protein [Bacteroidetes bacterium]|nr:iron-sulfur cluster assembly accessory protein [Bacteroidota bacterium]MDA0874557.1 iron-sulfur cluster assembly accessory protein [Bacteroidota bacterium]
MSLTETPVIAITDAALRKLKDTAAREGVDFNATVLRIAVVPGGCSGLTYDLGWDSVTNPQDEVLEQDGIRIAVDPRSAAYLSGTTLDFSDGLEGKGFHFQNPQAVRNCACGESFGL